MVTGTLPNVGEILVLRGGKFFRGEEEMWLPNGTTLHPLDVILLSTHPYQMRGKLCQFLRGGADDAQPEHEWVAIVVDGSTPFGPEELLDHQHFRVGFVPIAKGIFLGMEDPLAGYSLH